MSSRLGQSVWCILLVIALVGGAAWAQEPAASNETTTTPVQAPLAASPVAAPGTQVNIIIDGYLKLIFAIVLMVLGLVLAFFGIRLFRPTSFIIGMIFFGVVIFSVCWEHTDWKTTDKWWLALLIGGLAALVGGFLFLCIIQVAIFAIGAGLGVSIAALVLTTPLGTVVLTQPWAHILIVCGAGLVFGVLALIFQKTLVITGTSAFGSYMIASGVDLQWMKPEPILSQIIPNILSFKKNIFEWDEIKSNPFPYLLIAGMVVFTVAGIIVQTCFTGKNYDFRTGKTLNKRDPYGQDEPLLP